MSLALEPAAAPRRSSDATLVEAFEACADRFAERPAVVAADGTWSYAELDRRANRIAHHLAAQGGDAGRPVLLSLEPGALFAAAVLGTLKAGRFFVALDPVAPAERNTRIAADSAADLALTRGAVRARWTAVAAGKPSELLPTVDLDRLPDALPEARPERPAATGDALAALTYTSGSTGAPKGVMQSHRAVLHNVEVTRAALAVTSDDRYSLLYPPSVNPALRDLFTPLLCGAALLPFLVTLDGVAALTGWIAERELSVLCCGVTLFRQLAAAAESAFPGVRAVKLGGEPVTAREVALLRRLFTPPCRFYSGFGTTETGTATVCLAGHDGPLPAGAPLGRPADGVEIVLLDEAGEPFVGERGTAGGGEGEVAVRARHLSPGYWRDPELTARRFSGSGADRLYRSGDLARRLADGSLEHLGRCDAQIKVGGRRIEPREVERWLEAQPGVGAAAVTARPAGAPGELALVAYLVPAGGRPLFHRTLRDALWRRLPPQMVPAAFVVVPGLPYTANGKLDRRALDRLDGRPLAAVRSFGFPRDPIETRLAALWCGVLGRGVVGIDESFFDLGGDSLKAVELCNEIERRFGAALHLASLFEAPTVEEQAARLRDHLAAAPAPVVTLAAGGDGPPLFCVPAVDGYPFVYLPLARRLAGERPLHVLQFPGLGGEGPPLASVPELADELVARLRAVQPRGPYHLLGHSFGGLVAWEMCHRLLTAGERVASLALCDSHTRDSVPWAARRLRDAELVVHAARRLWREAEGRPARRLAVVARALAQTIGRSFARRRRNTLVEHTIHQVRRAATAARLRHRLEGRLDLAGAPVLLFRADPGPGEARFWCRWVEATNGWAKHLAAPPEVISIPGDHITMLQGEGAAAIAARLRR